MRHGFNRGGCFARAQQHDGGEYREAEQPERQREGGDLLAAQHRDGADHVLDEAKGRAPVGAGRRAERAAKRCKNEGGEESAPPRTRTQPLVRCPDRLRHSDLPQECERRPPRRSRIAGLYPQGESCRKSPDRERGLDCPLVIVLFANAFTRNPLPTPDQVGDKFSGSCARYFSACARFAMSSTLMRPSTDENVRSASTSAGFTTSLTSAELGSGGSSASSAVPAARRMSAALMRRCSRASS